MNGQRVTRSGGLAAVAIAVAMLAACSSGAAGGYGAAAPAGSGTPATASGALRAASTSAGTVLVDPAGKTLYVFAADSQGHSACTGGCAQYWPPAAAGSLAGTHPSGVTATLGTLTRADGTAQLTVNGFPVYTYAADSAPGQAKGQGVNASGGLWWVLTPSGSWITGSASPSASTGVRRY